MPQVQWDEAASIPRPDRVSPWEIEPFVASAPGSLAQPPVPKNKRPRPPNDNLSLGMIIFLLIYSVPFVSLLRQSKLILFLTLFSFGI